MHKIAAVVMPLVYFQTLVNEREKEQEGEKTTEKRRQKYVLS